LSTITANTQPNTTGIPTPTIQLTTRIPTLAIQLPTTGIPTPAIQLTTATGIPTPTIQLTTRIPTLAIQLSTTGIPTPPIQLSTTGTPKPFLRSVNSGLTSDVLYIYTIVGSIVSIIIVIILLRVILYFWRLYHPHLIVHPAMELSTLHRGVSIASSGSQVVSITTSSEDVIYEATPV
jgi:hypothetical protein